MTPKKRRDQRPKHPRPMKLTARDIAIVQAAHHYRVLRQDQLQRLFGCSKSVMQRVLIRLYEHGFLDRRFLPVYAGSSPTLYVFDRKGADLLRTHLGMDDLVWYNSSKDLKTEFLEHTTAINDVRIAITLASQAAAYELCKWVGENELKAAYDRVPVRSKSGKVQAVSLIPDGYFVLKTPKGYAHFFLEVDRGTETIGRFKTKIAAYMIYYQNGAYERRYMTKSMRVISVMTGKKRLGNLKAATEAVGGRHRFWFALLEELEPETILDTTVWSVAGESQRRALIE